MMNRNDFQNNLIHLDGITWNQWLVCCPQRFFPCLDANIPFQWLDFWFHTFCMGTHDNHNWTHCNCIHNIEDGKNIRNKVIFLEKTKILPIPGYHILMSFAILRKHKYMAEFCWTCAQNQPCLVFRYDLSTSRQLCRQDFEWGCRIPDDDLKTYICCIELQLLLLLLWIVLLILLRLILLRRLVLLWWLVINWLDVICHDLILINGGKKDSFRLNFI